MLNVTLDVVAILTVSLIFALFEIQVEGEYGWAGKLPTWRIESGWLTTLTGGKPLTGYHTYLWILLPAMMLLGVLASKQRLTLPLILRLAALYTGILLVEDFLWFVLNPAYGLHSFFSQDPRIWWHGRWIGPLPDSYYVGIPVTLGLYLLSFLTERKQKMIQRESVVDVKVTNTRASEQKLDTISSTTVLDHRYRDVDFLKLMIPYAAGLVLAIASFPFQKVGATYQKGFGIGLLTTLILVMCTAWFVLWVYVDHSEILRLDKCLDTDRFRRMTTKDVLSIMLLAILFGVILTLVYHPVAAVSMLLGLAIVNIPLELWIVRKIGETDARKGNLEAEVGASVIHEHFKKMSHMTPLIVRVVGFALSFCAVTFGRKIGINHYQEWAYGMILVSVIVAETLLWIWRRRYLKEYNQRMQGCRQIPCQTSHT